MFNQNNGFLGIQGPKAVLAISIAITLKSCITLHLKTVKTEKQFVPFTSTFFILLWGFFSTLRRIIAMVCLFIPSLGLFSILYYYKSEQIPSHQPHSGRNMANMAKWCSLWSEGNSWGRSGPMGLLHKH